jgi:hypothetical protein
VTGSTGVPDAARVRFRGTIAGLGSTSGVRIVVGTWWDSPYGAFVDVMLAEPDDTRLLLAPTAETAEFVAATYVFDDVLVVPIEVRRTGGSVHVRAGGLEVTYRVARRTPLGWALRAVPRPVATSVWWSRVTDPVARVLLRGVRTRGSAGHGRDEVYGATDHHAVDRLSGTWRGADLGSLGPVRPEPGFGFASTPERPSVTTLVTTVIPPSGSSLSA